MSMLPPWYLYNRSFVQQWTWKEYMRLTKVWLRKWHQGFIMAAGAFLGAAFLWAFGPSPELDPDELAALVDAQPRTASLGKLPNTEKPKNETVLASAPPVNWRELQIHSASSLSPGEDSVLFEIPGSSELDDPELFDIDELFAYDIYVKREGFCSYRLTYQDRSRRLSCF